MSLEGNSIDRIELENRIDDAIRDALDLFRDKDVDLDIVRTHIARLEALRDSIPERNSDLELMLARLRIRLRH